jgi:hypothetical protein
LNKKNNSRRLETRTKLGSCGEPDKQQDIIEKLIICMYYYYAKPFIPACMDTCTKKPRPPGVHLIGGGIEQPAFE